jgi:dTDP-glucose 4,6-dehydratase
MNILVTGGAGFIGSHFIEHLLRANPRDCVVNVDKLTYAGNLKNLKDVSCSKRYRFVQADICDAKKMGKIVCGCEAIIHFAAETHVDRSIKNSGVFIETNVQGTHVLLEAGLRHKIKRFLHVSTDEVYGSRLKGFFKETDSLSPSSPYAASKAASDLLVLAYAKTYKMPIVITRSSNNFGPRQYPEKVIPLFVTNLLKNKKVPLYADGGNVRDWIYVKDNCEAIELVFRKGRSGEIYNIAAGQYMTNLELTKRILKVMDKPLSMINYVQDRLGHDFRYAVDTTKVRKLGFSPRYSFEQGLTLTINGYCAGC